MLNWTNVVKWLKFQIRHCKNVHCSLSQISLHYQTVIGQTLTVFHQLFSWTSVGHSKCPIDKRSVQKAILQSQEYSEYNMAWSRSSFKTNSFEMNEIWTKPLKENCTFGKICLLFQTVLESEATSLSPTVHLDFSWTLKISVWSTKWSVRKAIWESEEFPEYHVY